MCFAPLLNVLRPLHQILAQYQFSSFFIFLFLDFLILTCEMLARSSSGWVLDYFLGKAWSYLFHIKKEVVNSHYFVPYLNFCDSFPNLKIRCVCQIWRGVLTMSYYDPKSSFIKKYKISAFQRTFERIHITFSRWNIFIWSSKIPSIVTFLAGFHILWISLKIGYTQLSITFFININRFRRFITHPKNQVFEQITCFWVESVL